MPTRQPSVQFVPPPPSFAPPAVAPTSFHNIVRLRYLASAPIRVDGPVSGRAYSFSKEQPNQAVDARDAEPLLRTRFFQRVF